MIAVLRRNLALIVAIFSLVATSAGGYSSYRLLEQKVAELEQESSERANRNSAAIRETRMLLDAHLVQTSSHMDAQKWELIMQRLQRIENKLDNIR